jgi:hypothetical protein
MRPGVLQPNRVCPALESCCSPSLDVSGLSYHRIGVPCMLYAVKRNLTRKMFIRGCIPSPGGGNATQWDTIMTRTRLPNFNS